MDTDIFMRPYVIGLKVIGAWPGFNRWSAIIANTGFQSFMLIFAFMYIREVYENLDLLVDNLINTTTMIVGMLKLIILRAQRNTLMTILNTMSEDWQAERMTKKGQVMKRNFEYSRSVCKYLLTVYNAPNLTFIIRTARSYIYDAVEDREFLAPISSPDFMDMRKSPLFEVMFVGELLASVLCVNSHALVEGMFVTSVLHASSKMDAVREEIMRFSKICRSHNSNKKMIIDALKRLVHVHVVSDEFSRTTENLFTYLSFSHIFLLTLAQVSAGYMFIYSLENGEKFIKWGHYGMETTILLLSCGYYCILGEHLITQNELLATELYNCFWCDFHISEQRAIRFMLVKSQIPVRLTFGKFDNLSLLHFSKIVKTSFSYLSLVRQV